METKPDLHQIMHHISIMKDSNSSIRENLNSINLLMVDENNSRVKDAGIAVEIKNLENKVREMSAAISRMEDIIK